MSVLKSLKGTFQNVQQDIVDGFRALTSLESSPRHEKIKKLRADGKSLDCGADLLYRYQKEWSELHNYTADTAKKAEEVDSAVTDMFTRYSSRWESACQLEEEMAALPAFTSTVNDMIQFMDTLQTHFQKLEEEMERLQNLCEEEALQKEKSGHVKQLAAYKKAKNAEAFSVKAKLWNSLKERSKEAESKKSHAMKERQEAFLEAFASDMDYYRKHGHTDKLPSVTEFPKVSSLSEISIDEDKRALDEFLSSAEGEHTEGGMFIEDDYTADYSAVDDQGEDFPETDDSRPTDLQEADPKLNGADSPHNSHHPVSQEPAELERTKSEPSHSVADSVEKEEEERETAAGPDPSLEKRKGKSVESEEAGEEEQQTVLPTET